MFTLETCPECKCHAVIMFTDMTWRNIGKHEQVFGMCAKCSHVIKPRKVHENVITKYLDDMEELKRIINNSVSAVELIDYVKKKQ